MSQPCNSGKGLHATVPAQDAHSGASNGRFAADRMLARLARWMRLLGADTIFDPRLDGAAMLHRARAEGRIMLTRDKRFKTARDAIVLESNDFRGQLRELTERAPFDRGRALTRCSHCNALLAPVDRELVRRRVPPYVYASNERFAECPNCGHIYWDATHPARMAAELAVIFLPLA